MGACYNEVMKCRVRAVVVRGDELLLVQNKDIDGNVKPFWVLPGGGIDEGESLVDALTREMIEETGVKPEIGRLLFVHQFVRDGAYEGPEFFFHVTNTDDFANIDLSNTSHGAQEIAEIGFHDTKELTGLRPGFLYGVSEGNLPEKTALFIAGPAGE